MKKLTLILAGLLILSSCQEESTKKTSTITTDTSESSAAPSNLSPSELGPTGSSDPVEDGPGVGGGSGLSYYDEADPVDPNANLVEVCGVAYRELNQEQILFLDDQDNMSKTINAVSFGAQSYLKGFSFPTTAKSVCFMGLRNNDNSVNFNELVSTMNVDNPSYVNEDDLPFFECGLLQRKTNYSDETFVEFTANNYSYRLNVDPMWELPVLPHTNKGDVTQERLEGCVASSMGPYNNYNITFTKFIDAEYLNFGVLQ